MKAPLPTYTRQVYPAGGFQLNLPDGKYVMGEDFEDLVVKVAKALELPLEAAEAFTHAKLCARFPSNCQRVGNPLAVPGGPTTAMLAGFHLSRLHESAPDRFERMGDTEADKRAAVCRACPSNAGLATPGCCGDKGNLDRLAAVVSTKFQVPKAFGVGWCRLTGACCGILARVDFLKLDSEDSVYGALPEECPAKNRLTSSSSD